MTNIHNEFPKNPTIDASPKDEVQMTAEKFLGIVRAYALQFPAKYPERLKGGVNSLENQYRVLGGDPKDLPRTESEEVIVEPVETLVETPSGTSKKVKKATKK